MLLTMGILYGFRLRGSLFQHKRVFRHHGDPQLLCIASDGACVSEDDASEAVDRLEDGEHAKHVEDLDLLVVLRRRRERSRLHGSLPW